MSAQEKPEPEKPMTEEQVKKFVTDWQRKLYLNEWDLVVNFSPNDHSDDDVIATITVDHVYLSARIHVRPSFFKESRVKQELALVHELCHIISEHSRLIASNLRNGVMHHDHEINDINEQLTQRIAMIAYYGLQK